jgi:hypothetical protein
MDTSAATPGVGYRPATRRWRANSESTTPAATKALRLSTPEATRIDMNESQFSRTSRERPQAGGRAGGGAPRR